MTTTQPMLEQAVKLHQQGKLDEAEWLYDQILSRNARQADAWHLLGVLDYQRGRLQAAVERIGRAIALQPKAAGYHANLASVQAARGQLRAAAETYRQALALEPQEAELVLKRGSLLEQLGEYDEAEQAFRRAIELAPTAEHLGRLAHFLENANRLDEARELAERGAALDGGELNCQLALAKCERRGGDHAAALSRLERVRDTHPGAATHRVLHFELGRLLDATGDYARAWEHVEAGNRLMSAANRQAAQPQRVTAELRLLQEAFAPQRVADWKPVEPADEGPDPIFVIGFPRSGTTLMCQILAGHPQLTALHERPTGQEVRRRLHELPGGLAHALATLDASQLKLLRDAYWKATGLSSRTKRIVDVNPLNMLALGPLLRVFPRARVIAIVRHPCDVCLSCFMQDFAYTDAMAHFTTLPGTVAFYDELMQLWRRYLIAVPHACHITRYEHLVQDFEGELRRLLAFVDLPWSDELGRFAERAATGSRIQTPSYHQVSRALYRNAVDRWSNYRPQLAPYLSTLAPWLEFCGYQA